MILDDGILRVYEVIRETEKGVKVEKLRLKFRAFFAYIGIGSSEWNAQNARDVEPVGRVRILQDRRVKTHNIIVMPDGEQCEAGRVYHGNEGSNTRDIGYNEGRPITDITLERPEKQYTLPEVEG